MGGRRATAPAARLGSARRSVQPEVALDELLRPIQIVRAHEQLARAGGEELGHVEAGGAPDEDADALLGQERRDHLRLDLVVGAGEAPQRPVLGYQASPSSSSSAVASTSS